MRWTQRFGQQSLEWGVREAEVFEGEDRVRVTFRIFRKLLLEPEAVFVRFVLPAVGKSPAISCGGAVFEPGRGQLPGTCMDQYAFDGTVLYREDGGSLVLSSRDAAVVSFGRPTCSERVPEFAGDAHVVCPLLFDNTWDTNFPVDGHGTMEFAFDVFRSDASDLPAAAGQALALADGPDVRVQARARPGG
jgi:hypothetical protein